MDSQTGPEQVKETVDTAPAQADFSAVNEPITGDTANLDQPLEQAPNSYYDAARGEEAMKSWEAGEDSILQENADYFDSEAARYREAGDDAAADASQEQADKARSLIGDSGQANADSAAPQVDQATDPSSDNVAQGSEAADGSESSERQLQDNADYFDSEAARYGELGDDTNAELAQGQADQARSLMGNEEADSADRQLQDNADYFDNEAARYREQGDNDAASRSQAQADRARSLIGRRGSGR